MGKTIANSQSVKKRSAKGAAPARMPAAKSELRQRYLVPALMRGLAILQELSGERRQMTLSEAAASLHITRSSAYRLLVTLSHLGFVSYDADTKTYALGAEVLRLGYGYLASRDLVEVAMPHLLRLRDRTGWSAHLGERHGRDVVYLARVPTRRSIASTVHIGTRLPADVTTMGRVLLSELPVEEVRDLFGDVPSGVAQKGAATLAELFHQRATDAAAGVVVVQHSSYEPGVASIAAPIRDMTGHIVAAINISAVALLTSDAELSGPLKSEVLAAASAISHDLGHQSDFANDKKTMRPMRRSVT